MGSNTGQSGVMNVQRMSYAEIAQLSYFKTEQNKAIY